MISGGALLSVRGITVRFGGVLALDSVSFDVPRGGVCGLIGPNGAGKTTLFNCLSRLYHYQEGELRFDGHSLDGTPVHRIAGVGIGRTFQNLAMFRTMSVEQNVLVGAHCRMRAGFGASAMRLPAVAREEARVIEQAREIMVWLGLDVHAARPVGDLPFGLQKRVELARAMVSDPKLLLLDEPAAGLNHEELSSLEHTIRDIRDRRGITVLLVEHQMSLVMAVSDHIVALNFGRKIAEGTPAEIQAHPAVIEAYLGAPAHGQPA